MIVYGGNYPVFNSKGFSQESFAYEVGLDRTYMGGIERGERNIAALNLIRIAKALKSRSRRVISCCQKLECRLSYLWLSIERLFPMQVICRLCEQESDLQESHIIPKFIYAYLKDTSPTGKLREGQNINLRKQDGIKLNWLCKSCENTFSDWEKYFAEKIFHPLQEGTTPIQYNEKFLKFCVSISWRVLKYIIEQDAVSYFSNEIQLSMQNTLTQWRKFLLDQTPNPGIHEQHFYNLSGTIENSTLPASSNIHRYLQRTVAIDVINWGPKVVIVYAKFPGLILTGFINVENRNDFRDTKIHVKNGALAHKKISFPQQLWDYINTKAEAAKKTKRSMSKKQKEKINADYRKISLDDVIASGTFQALQKDIELSSVEDVFETPDSQNTKKD